MYIKIIFAALAIIIGEAAFIPYIVDVWKKKTKPNLFTWLIWAITQGTATAGLIFGGGGIGSIPMILSVGSTLLVIALSIRSGSKNIHKSDVFIFLVALSAIFVWWQLDNPLIAVLMVSGIDGIGYIPTFRKSYRKPWTETAGSWTAFAVADAFAILALENYNLLTVSYLATIATANLLLAIYLFARRRSVKKP